MTKKQGYQNPSAPTPSVEDPPQRKTTPPSVEDPPLPEPPAVASSNPDKPLELIINPGVPVYDTRLEIHGEVFTVTPDFCVMTVPGRETFTITEWEHIAVGNICPDRRMLTGCTVQRDRLNGYAAVMREIEALDQFGLLPILTLARRELIRQILRPYTRPRKKPRKTLRKTRAKKARKSAKP